MAYPGHTKSHLEDAIFKSETLMYKIYYHHIIRTRVDCM